MRRNLFLRITVVLWLVSLAISQINRHVSDALGWLGIGALVIAFTEVMVVSRGRQLSDIRGRKYSYVLFTIGGAMAIGGAIGQVLGVGQPTIDVIEAIAGTVVGLSLLALFLAYLDSNESTG